MERGGVAVADWLLPCHANKQVQKQEVVGKTVEPHPCS